MNGYVVYVADCETTGLLNNDEHLDIKKTNDIIELSMCRIIFESDTKITREQNTWFMKPFNLDTIQDEALAVCGYKREDITHKTQ